MADQRRTITIAVLDEFSRPLRKMQVEVGSAEDAVQDFQKTMGSGGGFMAGVRNIRDMTMAFNGMVQSIGAVAGAVDEFATLGTTARRNEFVLKQLTGTTKEYEASLNAVTSALKGTVTEGEAAAIASQLLNLGLADSAEGIEEFTRISNVIAAMSPTIKTADEAIAQIGLTIANMSFMRLDQLGLSVADVKNRMKELQAATKGMTTEAAFQQAVMEGLSAKADLLGDGLIEIGGAQERLKAKFRGFKEELAKEVSAGLDAAVTSGEQLYTILDKLSARQFVIAVVTEITGSEETGKKAGGAAFLGVDLLNLGAAALEIAGISTRTQEVELELITSFNFAERDRRLASLLAGEDIAVIQAEVTMGEARPQTLGTGLELPGRGGPDALVLPVRLEVEPQSKISVMNEIFGVMDEIRGVSKEFDPATSGFAKASEEAAKLKSELKGGAQAAREIVGNITEISAPENLGEMFGIAPEAFDLSVYAAMQEALGDVEIDADLAAAAVENYKLQTGMATGASEIFAGQMDVLAADLASGALSANQYVAEVMALSQMDFSQIDSIAAAMIDQGDVQLAQEFIDVLSGPDGVAEFEEGMANAQMLLENLGLIPEEETPLQPILTDLDAVTAYLEDVESKWVPPIESAMNLATGEVTTFRETAVNDIDAIKAALERLKGNFTISVSTDLSGIGGGETESTVGGVPEFAEGGFTGNSTAPFLAMLHPNELVIPLDDLGAPGGGMQSASSAPTFVETTLMVNDFVLAQAVTEAKRKEGATV